MRSFPRIVLLTAATALTALAAAAGEWPHWRGPDRNSVAGETGLIAAWSGEAEKLVWRVDFVGRSTPVVFGGRVCASGRAGEGILRQEMVACFDAGSGEKLWEHRFNVYHTTVPWTRVGWANPTGDPETGFLYVQGVGGILLCLDSRTGEVVWERNLVEDFGFMEGYGGRTQTPIVDQDRLVVTFSNAGWGEQKIPRHRFFAFDKRTGELIWFSTPGGTLADKNSQSTPAVAVIGGRRMLIHGNGDGAIYAVDAHTGEKIWGYRLSKRGINASVVVDGTTVYASHGEDNVDTGDMGRIVAIDATGSGDVTATHELWRAPVGAGFSSPLLAGGRLYAVDNSANLHALDPATGQVLWTHDLGRVGKGSPVFADGRIYVTEVNGRFVIVDPGDDGAVTLSASDIRIDEQRAAEIYGSPAIAYGRIYFSTEEGLYCLGNKDAPFEVTADEPRELRTPPAEGSPAKLLVVPAEVVLDSGGSADFEVRAFDALGRPLGVIEAEWSLEGLAGGISTDGVYTAGTDKGSHSGRVLATSGELAATARARVFAPLPLVEDFEATAPGELPSYMMGYLPVFEVEEVEGNHVIAKGPSPVKIHRHITFLGPSDWSGYGIEADLLATRDGRKIGDVGLINSGYTMELLGGHQRLQIRSWSSALRMMHQIDFPWEPDVWYRMKLVVAQEGGKAAIRGKVWKAGTDEPAEWSIATEDPLPIEKGSPGLSGYSPATIYYDNVEVTKNP